jgi:sec-independent protein translocase protein TatA
MIGEFSVYHWLIVLVILLIFFGPSKLPQLGQSLGKAIRGFKESLSDAKTDKSAEKKDDESNKKS